MAQLVTCPECNRQLQVPDELLGKAVQCPECKNTFTAAVDSGSDANPESAEAEPAPAPSKSKKSRSKMRDRDDDDDDRDDDLDIGKKSRRRGGEERPGKVQAIGILMLIGGILAIMVSLAWGATCFGLLWPGMYYSLVMGILAIVRGAGLLGGSAQQQTPPTGIAVMMIINIINGDVVNCVLGIVCLIFCGDEEVINYLAR